MLLDVINEYFLGTETNQEFKDLIRENRKNDPAGIYKRVKNEINFYRLSSLILGRLVPTVGSMISIGVGVAQERLPWELLVFEGVRGIMGYASGKVIDYYKDEMQFREREHHLGNLAKKINELNEHNTINSYINQYA